MRSFLPKQDESKEMNCDDKTGKASEILSGTSSLT